jgi:hypothetical protein
LPERLRVYRSAGTLLWDVSDLTNPKLTGSHYAEMQSIDHNLYVQGDEAYLANYCSGLRILDATKIGQFCPFSYRTGGVFAPSREGGCELDGSLHDQCV